MLTPLMKQYWDIKALHADKILFFRMGDFFELFHEDAVLAAPLLGIALTSRNKKAQDETPMCGMPHHSVASPINKLLKAGYRVAICDQVEDPKTAKGLVKRAVTRILTPGMVFDSDTLRADLPNYMACLEEGVLAVLDTSSSEAFYIRQESSTHSNLWNYVQLLPIVEMVTADQAAHQEHFPPGPFLVTEFKQKLMNGEDASLPAAVCRLQAYVQELAGTDNNNLSFQFEERKLQKRLQLSSTVLRHLEIFETSSCELQGSFFSCLDRTKTSGGRRKLRSLVCFPWTQSEDILREQARIQHWMSDLPNLRSLRETLAGVGDLERRVGKVSAPQCNARDLLTLAESMNSSLLAVGRLQIVKPHLEKLATRIQSVLVEDPPLTVKQGSLIRSGVNAELDECIYLATNAQSLLQEMEEREKKETGISSLKIRYNNVFGYYIEVTHTHKDKVPPRYLRKQTLANAERFYTEELMELEKKVLSAQTRRYEMEFQIFEDLRKEILSASSELLDLAYKVSDLDVVSSLAWLGVERNYKMPILQLSSQEIHLVASRHPVVEQVVKRNFVANDVHISAGGCLLLTGPNMAGKSTLMRQVALTAILTQMGAPVPASDAKMPIFDAIYTRIGASDNLSQGLSTFMVEMTETAEMLKNATAKSLVILDEVGRGTSTYDGMSLAQAILEYLVTDKQSTILFATHYHELTTLPEKFPQVQNAHMSVGESRDKNAGEIRFLHTLKAGPAGKSYGVHVARIAGVPTAVTKRAEQILQALESTSAKTKGSGPEQLDLLSYQETQAVNQQVNEFVKGLVDFEISAATPLQALNQIAQWQKTLSLLSLN